MSNGLLKFLPSGTFHHSVKLNVGLIDALDPACSSRLSSGSAYVLGFLMSEKLQKVILTSLGM
jgi:hypothetical protein